MLYKQNIRVHTQTLAEAEEYAKMRMIRERVSKPLLSLNYYFLVTARELIYSFTDLETGQVDQSF
jgi:hypothetical protein